jgi:hypothetical protein
MKKILTLVAFVFLTISIFAEEENSNLLSIPKYIPDSDAFFAGELEHGFSLAPSFFFFDFYGDMVEIPGETALSGGSAARMVGSIGGLIPFGEYVSGIASVTFVMDSASIQSFYNLYTGAGAYGHYDPWGLGLGVFAGYYRNAGFDDPTVDTTNAVRFMIIPKIGLSDKIFFLDEIGAQFNFTEKADLSNLLGKLAFTRFQALAMKFGIDVYYKQKQYTLFLEDRSLGARFETNYFLIDFGYRWFNNNSNYEFLSRYQDGLYAKLIGKIPLKNYDILLSYTYETTFEPKHYFGLGISLKVTDWILDYLYEFSGINNMHVSGSNWTSLERYF